MRTVLRFGVVLCAAMVIFWAGVAVGQNKYGTPRSIVHVVTLKWKADATAEQKDKAIAGVKEMASNIPGIKNVWLKTLRVQGPSQEKRYDAAFAIEFEDQAAADRYVDHPAHKAWENIYLPVREESRSHQVTN